MERNVTPAPDSRDMGGIPRRPPVFPVRLPSNPQPHPMNFVRFCFALACLSVFSACNSSSAFYRFTHHQKKTARAACPSEPAVVASPPPANAPAAEPFSPPIMVGTPSVTAVETPVTTTPEIAVAPEVATPPMPVAVAVTVAAPEPGLRATRSGQQVTLEWTLPVVEDGYKAIEIMRNNTDSAKGRGRVRAVRASVTELDDTVENASERYWYWLKLTAADGVVTNLGPIEAVQAR